MSDEQTLDLTRPSVLRPLLARHGLHLSHAMGQNFLTDASVLMGIVDAANLGPTDGVLEIGPGAGTLTRALSERAGAVLALELDRRLAPVLAETLADRDNITVIWEDALRADIPALIEAYMPGLRPVVCANLPYQITSPILERLLTSGLFAGITVMVQKEVAERLGAQPGTKAYGSFSVFVQAHARVSVCFDVSPGSFTPAPKVTSAVVSLQPDPKPVSALFFRVVRAAFGQRRKTLTNALTAAFPLDRVRIADALTRAGVSPMARGETLDLDAFDRVAQTLQAELQAHRAD